MQRKPKSESKARRMHLEIRIQRGKPYGFLRTSYREDGKVRHETIASISRVPLEQLYAMRAALQDKMVMKETFKVIENYEYGASFACVALMKELGLHKMIYSRHTEEWVGSCLAMIAGRLVYAGSKLALSQCGSYSALWEICGIDQAIVVNTHCYEAMDRLLERQEAIQKNLAKQHLQNGTLVLYDITSCYLEGKYADSELVQFGYNRDGKRGHEQIVISLLCTKEGCPIAVEVLKGNTADSTTVLNQIAGLKAKYGLEKVIFVGDRGMVTQANYEKINHETVKVISALSHNAIKRLLEKGTIQLDLFDERGLVEVIDSNRRYCLCKNPVRAAQETQTRQALLNKTTEALDKILACPRKTKYSPEMRMGKIIDQYNTGKYIRFEGQGETLSYTINEAKIQEEAALDGCYIIYTDVSPQEMSAVEAVESYKSLIKVEQAFRSMKTVTLEIRPIYHKTDVRIKCHVFICMLAYYVMWHMKQRLQPLFKTNGKGAKRKYTFDYVMECLKNIRKNITEFCSILTSNITPPTDEQNRILELLQIKI